MKKCILAITLTGSCALLYLFYRMRSSKKKNNLESDSNSKLKQIQLDQTENSKLKLNLTKEEVKLKSFETNDPLLENIFDDKDKSNNITDDIIIQDNESTVIISDMEKIIETTSNSLKCMQISPNKSVKKLPDKHVSESTDASGEKQVIPENKAKKRNRKRDKSKKTLGASDVQNCGSSDNSNITQNLSAKLNDNLAPSPDQAYASDLDRESHSPEQESNADTQSSISHISLDSGQGSLEVDSNSIYANPPQEKTSDPIVFYQFKVPQDLVGRLIGRKGAFVNRVKSSTFTDIILLDYVDNSYKLCSVEGEKANVIKALDQIRDHFPTNQFPDFDMDQVNTPVPSPQHQPLVNKEVLQLDIPPGIVLEVQAGAVISTGEIWLQQPLHPTFSALTSLHQCLNVDYSDGGSAPLLPMPIPANTVCVCLIGTQWFRCQVLEHADSFCTVSLLDVGGIVSLPVASLRQIRTDYMSLPFQSTQCYLYAIEPLSESGWSDEGRLKFLDLVKNDILYVTIAAYSQNGVPLVNLYQRKANQYHLINKTLVDEGYAKWMTVESADQ